MIITEVAPAVASASTEGFTIAVPPEGSGADLAMVHALGFWAACSQMAHGWAEVGEFLNKDLYPRKVAEWEELTGGKQPDDAVEHVIYGAYNGDNELAAFAVGTNPQQPRFSHDRTNMLHSVSILSAVYVPHEFWGEKYGAALVEKVMAELGPIVVVSVTEGSYAHRKFYPKYGFREMQGWPAPLPMRPWVHGIVLPQVWMLCDANRYCRSILGTTVSV